MKKCKILIIDDSADNLSIYKQTIKHHLQDCEVITAESGKEGLRLAEQHDICGALIDVQMPNMDGLETCRRLKNNPLTKHIPAVLITAFKSTTEQKVQGLEAGADDFISKPIDDLELVARIKVILRVHRAEKELRNINTNLDVIIEERTKTLKETEEKYHRLFSAEKDAIIFFDSESGQITETNNGAVNLYGYTSHEFLQMTIMDIFEPQTMKLSDINKIAFSTRSGLKKYNHHHKDSTAFPVEVSYCIIPVNDNTAVCAIIRNITESVKLETQLRQSQKMEAIGQLAGGIAHDFNNLIQVIKGYSEITMNEIPPESIICKNIEQIYTASNRAQNLVRKLLAFSRRQILQPQNLDIDQLIKDLMKMLCLVGENINIDVIKQTASGTIYADRGQVEQVITNLCLNARDAMPEGGTITIKTENVHLAEDYVRENAWAKTGSYIILSISDTGCGIDESLRQHIFEPFFTTKEVGKGTGLGLATVYGIIKQHDGFIQLESEPGIGTTFKIYMPMVENQADSVTKRIPKISPGGSETILIAEDEKLIRDLAIKVLEGTGYKVYSASDGEEAIKVFERNANKIDLALLDIVMPKMSGLEAHKQMMSIKPNLKILFSSGYSARNFNSDSVLKEGVNLIQKPFDMDTLLEKIRTVLDS
jgi:PAS domain S-box-containing protein